MVIYYSGGCDCDWKLVYKNSDHLEINIMLTFLDNYKRPEKIFKRVSKTKRRQSCRSFHQIQD